MAHPSVDKFGKLIVTSLRDRAIDFFDLLAKSHWKTPGLQRLQSDLRTFTPAQLAIVRRCIMQSIDHGMHDFLFALVEAHECGQSVEIVVNGENVVPLSDGLHGEQFTDDGWIARFGKHPELPDESP